MGLVMICWPSIHIVLQERKIRYKWLCNVLIVLYDWQISSSFVFHRLQQNSRFTRWQSTWFSALSFFILWEFLYWKWENSPHKTTIFPPVQRTCMVCQRWQESLYSSGLNSNSYFNWNCNTRIFRCQWLFCQNVQSCLQQRWS